MFTRDRGFIFFRTNIFEILKIGSLCVVSLSKNTLKPILNQDGMLLTEHTLNTVYEYSSIPDTDMTWFYPLQGRSGIENSIQISTESKEVTDWVLSSEAKIVEEIISIFSRTCSNGGIFVDSGANEGLWSLIAAKYGCSGASN